MKINELDKKELIKLNKWNKLTMSLLEKDYPVQYIIGYVDFYGLKINVNEFTLIPRYETEYLIELTLKEIKKLNLANPKILDLCTGSGAIGLTLKSLLPSSEVTLSDISKDALMVANKNKNELNLDVNIIESDLFKNIQGKFDVIISNPPYVMTNETLSKDVLYEPHLALYSGPKGIDHIEEIFKNKLSKEKVAFVGDGINDAPVLARADVGIAMGALGSDAAIEAADVVLMTDEPSKIAKAIEIARKTNKIVWQNIVFVLGVKAIVLILSAGGVATMWEAIFADVGVALIAVLNAMRVMK